MAAEKNDPETEQREESAAERAAKHLRLSQWSGGEWQGTRVSGTVVLVAVRKHPEPA
jgi:ABC-type cobalamin transport system ATPase subunit